MSELCALAPEFTQDAAAAALPLTDTWTIDDDLFIKTGGIARVYYGNEGGQPRTALKKPILIAGPFPGSVQPDALYGMLDRTFQAGRKPLLTALREDDGFDIVLASFVDPAVDPLLLRCGIDFYSVEMQTCIRKAVAALNASGSQAEMVVAGVSMGGLVARHALVSIERSANPHHRTGIFISWDSPHRGAMLPPPVWACVGMSATYLALFFGREQLFFELNSRVARQMLFHRVVTGPQGEFQSSRSPDFESFMEALWAMGGHPTNVRARYAIANGAEDGRLQCQPGAVLIHATWPGSIELTLRADPVASNSPPALLGFTPTILGCRFETEFGESLTAAPGGSGGYLPEIAKVLRSLGADVRLAPGVGACFVPTRSALDMFDNAEFNAPVHVSNSNFDEIVCGGNTGHCDPVPSLMQFLYDKITGPWPTGPAKPVKRSPSFTSGTYREEVRSPYVHNYNAGAKTISLWIKGNGINARRPDLAPNGGTGQPYQPAFPSVVYNYELWEGNVFVGNVPTAARPDSRMIYVLRSASRDMVCVGPYPFTVPPPLGQGAPQVAAGNRRYFHFLNLLPDTVTMWSKGGLVNKEWAKIAPNSWAPAYEPYNYGVDFTFEFWSSKGDFIGALGGQSVRDRSRLIVVHMYGETLVLDAYPGS